MFNLFNYTMERTVLYVVHCLYTQYTVISVCIHCQWAKMMSKTFQYASILKSVLCCSVNINFFYIFLFIRGSYGYGVIPIFDSRHSYLSRDLVKQINFIFKKYSFVLWKASIGNCKRTFDVFVICMSNYVTPNVCTLYTVDALYIRT